MKFLKRLFTLWQAFMLGILLGIFLIAFLLSIPVALLAFEPSAIRDIRDRLFGGILS